MKLVFVSPTYGPVDSAAIRYQRAAIMHATNHGVTWVGDMSPERMKFDAARNNAVRSVLTNCPEAEAIFWCDSDVILPVDAISRLANSGLDFITGIYFQRYPPHWPLISYFNQYGGYDGKGAFAWYTDWPANTIAPIDGCGFGCVLTSTKMLMSMDAPWFTFERFSEDFDFCLRAKKSGFQLHVDTGILCGHLADPQPIGIEEFNAQRPFLLKEREARDTQAHPSEV